MRTPFRNAFIAGSVAALFGGLALSAPASATPIEYALENVVFNDGVTAAGTFSFDADTGTYSDIDVTTSSGHAYTFADPRSAGNSTFALFLASTAGDLTGVFLFTVQFATPLTDAGLGAAILSSGTGFSGFSEEGTCTNSVCGFLVPVRGITSGSVVAVPEAPTTAFLVTGLAGLAMTHRRRATCPAV